MSEENKSSFISNDPYRFDKTGEFLVNRYNSIRSRKERIETEQRIKNERKKQ